MTQPNQINLSAIQGMTPVPAMQTWFDKANCKGKTHLMFPKEHKDITYITQARNICKQCTVKEECLTRALEYPAIDMHGVWAGLTSRQLATEQKRRGIKAIRPSLAQMFPASRPSPRKSHKKKPIQLLREQEHSLSDHTAVTHELPQNTLVTYPQRRATVDHPLDEATPDLHEQQT